MCEAVERNSFRSEPTPATGLACGRTRQSRSGGRHFGIRNWPGRVDDNGTAEHGQFRIPKCLTPAGAGHVMGFIGRRNGMNSVLRAVADASDSVDPSAYQNGGAMRNELLRFPTCSHDVCASQLSVNQARGTEARRRLRRIPAVVRSNEADSPVIVIERTLRPAGAATNQPRAE